jgi:hypothetical protein|tara:strand:- start:1 stop:288 length:288 start_codon:yes stop_codon:yes gene_type:complete
MIIYKLKYDTYNNAVLDLMNKAVFLNSKLDYAEHIEAVVFINKILKTEGTYDEQDRVLTEPTYEDGYFVDVMSSKEIEFDNIVTPNNPVHVFANN